MYLMTDYNLSHFFFQKMPFYLQHTQSFVEEEFQNFGFYANP
jgi:hypothetical protein